MRVELTFDEEQTGKLMRLLDIKNSDALTAEAVLTKLHTMADTLAKFRTGKPLAASFAGGSGVNAMQREVARRRKAAGLVG